MFTPARRHLLIFVYVIGWLSSSWAEDGFRICFRETERSSQCQGPSYSCSGWSSNPAWTQPFRDDTDQRSGGCRYQWKIEAHHNIRRNKEYRLCFAETEGSSQCQGSRRSCTDWSRTPSWTSSFRDDTDRRSGGCKYAWKIESRITTITKLQRNQFVESALKKQKEALSVRVPAKAAVDGAQTRFPHGHCRFEMTPIIVEEAALILGIWTAPQNVMLRFVRETLHAPERKLHNFRTASI